MQIRVGNRQDEPVIRTIVFGALEELGIAPDLESRDRDLRDIEHNYFWFDGVFLVAEREGQLIGVAAARRTEGENCLELCRLAVASGARRQGVASALLKTLVFFAQGMEYARVVITASHPSADLAALDEDILTGLGFQRCSGPSWTPGPKAQSSLGGGAEVLWMLEVPANKAVSALWR